MTDAASSITKTTPLRLDEAVRLAFPAGGMTVSGLRTEKRKGRLRVEMIAGKEFTTLEAIEQMRQLCRDQQKAPGSISASSETPRQHGSSETDRFSIAQAAAMRTAMEQKERFRNTLRANTPQNAGNVLSMKSRSATS